MRFEDFALITNVLSFASRSKAEAKPQRRTSASSSTRTVLIGERKWTDIEPQDYSSIDYPVSKQLSTLLRPWSSTSRRRWSDWILEIKGVSSERFYAISTLVWRKVKEHHGKRRRKQEKISILYWSNRTRNSWSPSSSRSFRTQSHWSFIIGQCCNSERFVRVHLSHRMCNQFTLHHKFRIHTRRTKIEQKTDGIFHICESYEQGTQRSRCNWLGCTASCLVPAENVEETSKHGVLGRHQTCLKKGWSSIRHVRTLSFFTKHSHLLLYSESCSVGNWRGHIRESICVTSTSSEDFF